jgi:hypothetical protein
MKSRILAFIGIVAMSVIGPANAKFYKGEHILKLCESAATWENGFCSMYLHGVQDTYGMFNAWKQLDREYFCIPDGVTFEQLRKVFIKYANEHPDNLHWAASIMVLGAFNEAFPCE